MAEPAVDIDFYAPRFEIRVNDKSLPRDAVIGVDIDESLDKPGMFTLNLNEGLDVETQRFTWLDSDSMKPGNEVTISFGYASKLGRFTGKIKALSPSFPSTGVPTLKVEGYETKT